MTPTSGDAAFAEAAAMVSAGNLAGAEARLRDCLAVQPDHQNAELTLANILMHRQAWLEAEPVLRTHLKRGPTVDALLMLARVLENTGRIVGAEQCYQDVLQQAPMPSKALGAIAEFYGRNKARREAAKYWKRYADLNPTEAGVLAKCAAAIWPEAPDEAVAVLERGLAKLGDDQAAALRLLESLAMYKEWRGRIKVGLPPYHGRSVDDLHFRFAAAEVARFAELAATFAARMPTDANAQTKYALALLATGHGHELETYIAPVADQVRGHVWSNVRGRDSGFYEKIAAMSDADILRGLPPVETVLAASFADAPVAYLSCDFRYFTMFATPLLRSLAANCPGAQVHVHIMDAPEHQAREAITLLASLGLRGAITRETVLAADQETPDLARAYFHAVRFIRFYQHLKTYGRTLWLMDVDGLFNRPPSELYAQIGNADVAMRVRPGRWEPWNQFNACVVGASATTGSIEYFRLIAAYVAHFHQAKRMRWGIDQLAMYGVYEYLRHARRAPTVAVLDEYAVDYDLQDRGIMWCNSGFGKFAGREQLACRDPDGARYTDLLARYSS